MVFKTELSKDQIIKQFHENVEEDNLFAYTLYPNQYIGKISNDTFTLKQGSRNRNRVLVHGNISGGTNTSEIYIEVTNIFIEVQWLLTILLGIASISMTITMIKEADFSFVILLLYFVTILAYIVPMRLFEFKCDEAKHFFIKTFQAKEITGE